MPHTPDPTGPVAQGGAARVEVPQRTSTRRGDRIFAGLTAAAAGAVVLILVGIAGFLVMRSVPALQANTANFFTEPTWFPDAEPAVFGIAALAFGTIVSAGIAMLLAVPVGLGVSLFIVEYASPRVATILAFFVDLLAAVPSIIFGLWGLQVLMPNAEGLQIWLDHYLGFIPLFDNTQDIYMKSIFVASLVLAVMILPTISSITREVLNQVPRPQVEAALALGATRWEMVRTAMLPFARPGLVSASMLGLGRALGETIAVALLLSSSFDVNWHLTEPGGTTFAANIALKWNEAGDVGISALIASGLVLFVITFAVNVVARGIIARHAELQGGKR